MNCPNCGTTNLDTSSICVNCGRPLHGTSTDMPPDMPSQSNTYTPPPPPPPAGGPYTPPPPPMGGSYTPPPPHIGGPGYGHVPGAPIPNYLVQSILVTLCCCLPLGIVAIIFGAQVNSRLAVGDVAGATDASNKARLFCWLAVGLGLGVFIIGMLLNGAALLSALASNQ